MDSAGIAETGASDSQAPLISSNAVLTEFLRSERPRLILSAFLATLGTICQVAPYLLLALIIVEVMDESPSESRVWDLIIVLTVLVILRFILMGAASVVSHTAAFRIQYEFRLRLANHMARLPLGYFSTRSSGELKKVVADDVGQMEIYIAHNFPDAISALLVSLSSIAILFVVDWRLALATLFPIVVAFLVVQRASWGDGSPEMIEYHDRLGAMNARIVEFIQALPVVKVFNRLAEQFTQAGQSIQEYGQMETRFTRDFMKPGTFFYSFVGASILTVLPLGMWLYSTDRVSLETLVIFLVLGIGVSGPLLRFFTIMHTFVITVESGRRILSVLAEPELPEPVEPREPADNSITFEQVRFGYGEREVLHDISFTVPKGTVTAIVGPSGSGKTTIARLVPRFWDVHSGSVSIGGVDVRQIPHQTLLANVAFVFQDVFLFRDTIANNIRFGRPGASDDDVIAAARAARCMDFIRKLPNGLETVVGERGSTLSGGEKQRVALARAILMDAPIVVLDEATAFADPENEALIQDAISRLVAGKTLLVIAHRLSSITQVDQILVMQSGEIIQRGTHQELVLADGLYRDLWRDHLSAMGWSFGERQIVAGGVA